MTNNYEKIKNMSIEKIPEMLSIEYETKSKEGHIKRWYLGLDNEIYSSRNKMIKGVIAWLKKEVTNERK